jgi:HEAT repeat protein
MQSPAQKLFVTTALLIWGIGSTISCISAQARPSVQQLFQDLQSTKKTDRAEVQLLRIATSNEQAKRFLASNLPALIEEDPTPTESDYQQGRWVRPVWRNSVQLAGELRIAAAVPALVKWFTVSTSPFIGLGIGEESLVDTPAGQALANIGDPSISSLQPLLSRQNLHERYHAAYVLLSINSPKADTVLRDYVGHGQDRDLADFINNRLGVRDANKPN